METYYLEILIYEQLLAFRRKRGFSSKASLPQKLLMIRGLSFRMRVTVVVPTYNERENLPTLVRGIFSTFKKNKIRGNVIIVDDNSPDGTGELADEMSRVYDLKVIHKKLKLGIGSAYITGFREAIKDADVIFSMDADLSHDPAYIPAFLKNIGRYDVVVGSRYIAGGRIKGWDAYRNLVSKYANLLVHLFLRMPVLDTTSGYKAYKREVLENICLGTMKSSGYSFQIETLYLPLKQGYSIGEIPIIFRDRTSGDSKLSRLEILRFVFTLLRLRF